MFLSGSQKARSVRQTYLGPSGQKRLSIVDRDKPDPEKAFIWRLPHEILAHIINIIASDPNHSPDNHGTWRQLSVSPEATKQLIAWPKSLVHFYLGSFYDNPFCIDLPMLSEWLAIHKDTLKSIDIGSLSRGGDRRLFNACDFPKLEVLALSRWQLAGWSPHRDEGLTFSPLDADLLLGASLHTFTLDFTVHDQHSESWTDFGEREEHWVAKVARAAITRKAALRKIKIIFTPDYWTGREEDGYPWDRMDRIHDEISPHGLVLEYNKPALTKEEWLQVLRQESCAQSDTESLDALEMEDSERTYEGGDIREYFPRL
ncbi:unnamed protein product [Aspergillus oryzae]|uniref:Unnamed protein product n=2 Tax=Aspergillus oryzae TaxID=5062 RepID=A0AAN5BSU1_ASPOZ|nr:unnamed protein product [Aspergillus oryzae]GMF85197.1 unnamed protein product [Aspergillus oryzae]GMG23055.1 unnamed protein product [Aspergillus oryzae]GMG43034.1 unnamed protein product [Aspergillus oryzae var. brunneus]